jgi:hypothetical protein
MIESRRPNQWRIFPTPQKTQNTPYWTLIIRNIVITLPWDLQDKEYMHCSLQYYDGAVELQR